MEEPVKRRGRPPKAPELPNSFTDEPAKPVLTEATVERAITTLVEAERFIYESDNRIGTQVGDCERIAFHDDREYRVEGGVIVERVR